jgi:hypothetical protein
MRLQSGGVMGRKYLLRFLLRIPSPGYAVSRRVFEGRLSRGKTRRSRMRRGEPGARNGRRGILGGRNVLSTFQTFPQQHFCNLPPIVCVV